MKKRQVPVLFWDDHIERCNLREDLPEETQRGKVWVTVLLTDEEIDELRSDAEHYSTGMDPEFNKEYPGLIGSARATLRTLAGYEGKKS